MALKPPSYVLCLILSSVSSSKRLGGDVGRRHGCVLLSGRWRQGRVSYFILFFNLVIFWLRWVFVAARGLSLVVASGGYSLLRCTGFSWRWLLLLWSMGSRRAGSVVVGTGLVAPRHVGSSRTRDRTRVPCIGRRILNHCATR